MLSSKTTFQFLLKNLMFSNHQNFFIYKMKTMSEISLD